MFCPWVFFGSMVFLLQHFRLWNWKLALWGPHVFYFCRNCRSISRTACFLASKKKELNGFPYEGSVWWDVSQTTNEESIENDYSGSFDVLSEISLLSFCIQPKRWIPFPIPIMSWCDLTQNRLWMGYVSSKEGNRWIWGLCWFKIRQCTTPPIVEVTLIRLKWRYWHMYVPSLKYILPWNQHGIGRTCEPVFGGRVLYEHLTAIWYNMI